MLTDQGYLPLVKAETKLPHITGVCSISAGGAVFRLIIILKQLKSLRSFSQFTPLASFASSNSGWLTNDLFIMFATDFCAQLCAYRLTFPPEIADEPVLLILDGHASRANVIALTIFDLFNVDVLILPGHTTHVLQPPNLCINSPMKGKFKEELMREVSVILELIAQGNPSKADALRCRMAAAFLNAFHAVTTHRNRHSAFEATGLVPFNLERPQEFLFVSPAPDGIYEGVIRRKNHVNAELLTDFDSLQCRFAAQYGRPTTDEGSNELELNGIWNQLMQSGLENGRVLTPKPKMWMMTERDRQE